jgi:hypothetical protein
MTCVSYGPCEKCGYKTDCKQRYIAHLLRKTDCEPNRGRDWIINETQQLRASVNAMIKLLTDNHPEDRPLRVTAFRKDYNAIIISAKRLRVRLALILPEGKTLDESLAEFDGAINTVSEYYRERVDMYHHDGTRGVDSGMNATGVADGADDEGGSGED